MCPCPPPPLQTDKELRLKYLDDALAGECINLKTQVRASQPIIGPRTFHDRNGLELIPGASLLQGRLNDLKDYTMHHDMSINLSKTRIIPFNWTRKHQVFPRLTYDDKEIQVTYKAKLLGVMCSSDGKWNENTSYIVKKANSRMFFIRRLKKLGASYATLKEAYILFVRQIFEMCAPLWTGALVKVQYLSDNLERVQRSFCKLLYPTESYEYSRALLNLKTLRERRIDLSRRTAVKMSQNPKYSYLFTKVDKMSTRSGDKFRDPKWKSLWYGYSAIPFLTRLVNGEEPV